MITGCDSGLGYSLAHWCHDQGLVVVAACHSHHSNIGADNLEKLAGKDGRMFVVRSMSLLKRTSNYQP